MYDNPVPEHSEELPVGYLPQQQYFSFAMQAVKELQWQLVSADYPVIMCHTNGGGASYGESVTITIADGRAVFHSRSVNEYYWTDNQNIINAEAFKNAVAAVIHQANENEKNLKPLNRAKLGALVPSHAYLVTPILIYINVLVFIVMVLSGVSPFTPATQDLLAWGGNFRSLNIHGDWWRLFTYMFLHAGVLHLLMNMYALLYIGMFLEPLIGKLRFTAAYLLTGICAGLMSITIHAFSTGVGASGAIFGMYGVFLAMLTTRHLEKTSRNTLLRSILFFIILNLFNGIKGNVDNAAHIGGLLSGIGIGYIYYPGISARQDIKKQMLLNSVIAAGVALLSVFTLHTLTDDIALFEQKMQKFKDMESMALEFYHMPRYGKKKKDILYALKDRGIYYWNEDLTILSGIGKLGLPAAMQKKMDLLKQYCNTEIDLYTLLYNDALDTSYKNMPQIRQDNERIKEILRAVRE